MRWTTSLPPFAHSRSSYASRVCTYLVNIMANSIPLLFSLLTAVVFFSFWQQVLVATLGYYKVYTAKLTYSKV
jgi:hypothetical protein